jgi:hypothetical protein
VTTTVPRTDAAQFIDVVDPVGTAEPFVASTPGASVGGAPQIGLSGSVGSGKTRLYIQQIKDVLARDPSAVVVVSVPDHELAREVARRLQSDLGSGFPVDIWRGMDRPDPDAPAGVLRKMCQRSGDADAVLAAGGSMKDLCGSPKRGFCPHHPKAGGDCGYIRQGERAKSGIVKCWVTTHAMLGRSAPEPLRRFIRGQAGVDVAVPAADFLVIDESFWRSMIGETTVSVDMLDPSLWRTVPDDPKTLAPAGFADGLVSKVLGLLAGEIAAAGSGGRIDRAALTAVGLSTGECREAGAYLLRCKEKLPGDALPTAPGGGVKNLLRKVAANNRRTMRVHRMLNVAAEVLDGRLGSAALKVRDTKSGRDLVLTWRHEISDDWLCAKYGVIHADATMSEELVRVWLSRLVVPPWKPVAAPHQHVTQVRDRAFGYSSVIAGGKPGLHDPRATEIWETAAKNAGRVMRVIKTLAAQYNGQGASGGWDVLVVLPKALEAEFKGKLPPNVATLHFGKLRGQDDFKGVGVLLMVSRPLPPPGGMEDVAEVIFGRDVARLPPGAFYPKHPGTRRMADGTGLAVPTMDYHRDPFVEIVRRACCEDEITQATGRGRGIHRTATNPLDVIVLTNVPLPDLPVTVVVTLRAVWRKWGGEDPVRELDAAGVMPMDWTGLAAVLARLGFFARAANKADACRGWFRDNPRDGKRLTGLRAAMAGSGCANVREIPENNLSSWDFSDIRASEPFAPASPSALANPTPGVPIWPSYRYRRRGERKASRVRVSTQHPNPRTAVETLMGSLDMFEPENAPSTVKRTRRSVIASVAVPAVVPLPQDAARLAGAETTTAEPAALTLPTVLPNTIPVVMTSTAVPVPTPSPPALSAAFPVGLPTPRAELLNARLDAVPIGLPALMVELLATGAISAAGRRLHMDRFRAGRGPAADRERATVARLTVQFGTAAITNACRAAAARKLGISDAVPTPRQAA